MRLLSWRLQVRATPHHAWSQIFKTLLRIQAQALAQSGGVAATNLDMVTESVSLSGTHWAIKRPHEPSCHLCKLTPAPGPGFWKASSVDQALIQDQGPCKKSIRHPWQLILGSSLIHRSSLPKTGPKLPLRGYQWHVASDAMKHINVWVLLGFSRVRHISVTVYASAKQPDTLADSRGTTQYMWVTCWGTAAHKAHAINSH